MNYYQANYELSGVSHFSIDYQEKYIYFYKARKLLELEDFKRLK